MKQKLIPAGTKIKFDRRYKSLTPTKKSRQWFEDTTHVAPKKKRNIRYNTPRIIKFAIGVVLFCWFCTTIEVSNKPFNQPKAEANEYTPVSSFPKVYYSADMPAQVDLYEKYFGNKASEAKRVMKCESSGNPKAKNTTNKNGSVDYGLFQINSLWLKVYGLTGEQLLDEETNVATAKKIFDRSGNWSAWKASYKCHGIK